MKRYLLFLFTILISFSLSAQCLGDDCSIKGRNKAAKKKAVKMTGSKRAGNTYSASGKKRKLKRKSSQGFDPFASNSSKKNGAGGYDPFEDYDKKKKKKGGNGYDPFADNSKRKRKGNSGGYDPFETKKGRKGVASAGGYDPFEKGKKNKFKNSSSSYDGWDSNTSSVRKRKGQANDSWASGYGSKSVAFNGNDSWANGKSHKNPSGGTWLTKANPFKSHGGGNSNWDQDNSAGFGPPSYERQDNIARSYDNYSSSNFSTDVVFNRPHYYKYSLIYGGVIKHSSKVDAQLEGTNPRPVLGAEFGIEYPTQGEKNWHHYFNMPTYGYALTYLNLGEDDRLGSAIALYPYLDIPLVRTKAVDFNFSNGVGIAYVTKYDKTTSSNPDPNPATNADASYLIGSPANIFFKSGLNISWRPVTQIRSDDDELNSRYTINAGLSWMHLSNGNISSPNTGINMWGANLTLKHTPMAVSDVLRQKPEDLLHIISLDITGTAGIREFYRLEDQKYVVGNLNVLAYYQAANIYKIGLGVDAFYDEVFQYNHVGNYYSGESSKYDGLYDPSDILHSVRGGVCLSNEFVFGRTSAAFDAGYYVYDNIKADNENMYYRFALKYRFTTHFFGAAAIKTHELTNAEFFTLGVGYSFDLY